MAEVALTPFGAILRARGLKGELLLQLITQSSLSKEPKVVWLGEDYLRLSPWDVEYLHVHQQNAFLKLRKIQTRREAEFLRGLLVYIPQGDLQTNQWEQLIGFQVIGKTSSEIQGEIVGLDYQSSQPRLVIRLIEQKELLYPAVAELIEAIDWQRRVVHLKMLDELMHL